MIDNDPQKAAPLEKREMMEKIGRTLEERRKLRRLSISDISQSLKIRASFLEALEAGNWGELPGEVFARGFAIRYAQFIGLNGRELLSSYIDGTTTDARAPSELSPQFKKSDAVKSPWIWLGIGILFIAGLVKFLTPNAPPAAATQHAPAPKEEKPAPADNNDSKGIAAKPLEKHKLDVFAPEQLWLRIKASDKTFEGFIPEGATWTFSGEGQFDIHMGHSRNVALSFDGRAVALTDNQKRVLLPNAN